MKIKAVSGIMLTVLLIGMLTLTFKIQQAESSEPTETEWTRTYGGASGDRDPSVVQTSDGGYTLAGWTISFGAGSADFWLVKVAGPTSVDKFVLLAPYIGLASAISIAIVATAIYVKRRKKKQ